MTIKNLLQTACARVNTLPVKIFTLFWLIFILLLMVAFIIPRFDVRQFTPLQADELRIYQNEIASSIKDNRVAHLLISSNQFILEPTRGLRPILVDKNGKVIGARETELPLIHQFILGSRNPKIPMQKVFYNFQIAGPFPVNFSTNTEENKNYNLYFVRYVNPQKEIVNFIFDNPLAIILMIMLITSPLLWWLVSSISNTIKGLQEAANQVAAGNYKIDRALESTGSSEVRLVGESFNRMAEAIDDLIMSRQTLLSSISHELRTPLTRLQLSLSLLRRRIGDTTEINRIQVETERLDKMIKDLLALSHQHLKSQLFREIMPVTEVWEDVKEDAEFEAAQMKIECRFKQNIFYPQQYKISANRESIASAIENILRNAVKYAKTKVEVTEYLGNGYFFICVDDDGEGVPPKEFETIFKPFYRVNADQPNSKEGTGLGLAIVVNVAQQHRGNVWAESSPLGGLRVTLQLPLYKG